MDTEELYRKNEILQLIRLAFETKGDYGILHIP